MRRCGRRLGGTVAETKLDGRYLRCEFRTLGGFPGSAAAVDDVEFLFEVRALLKLRKAL